MKSKILLLVVIIVALLVLGALLLRGGSESIESTGDGEGVTLKQAPSFNLKDYEGNLVSLSDFAGRPVVVNSWAAWCPFCRKELPDFAEVQKEFGDQVVVIAIDRAESLEKAKQYSDELGVTEDLVFLLDPNDSFYADIGGFTMPETIFVDREGLIREHKRGPLTVDDFREKVASLAQE
jgi:thiol-disulfide isomerase/thioredoxin